MKKRSRILLISGAAILAIVIIAGSCQIVEMSRQNQAVATLAQAHPAFSQQWGLYNSGQEIEGRSGVRGIDINILGAWEYTKGSPEVLVGVLDSGINVDLKELKSSILINESEVPNNGLDDDDNSYVDDRNGWNFYHNTNCVYDNYLHDHHGTFLAGIISASHDESAVCGIAPGVRILPLKFLQGSQGQTKDAIRAIAYAHEMGAQIVNCSWDTMVYDEELKQVMERYSDILFICSAGKNGKDTAQSPVYPACYDLPNVISVTAVDNRGELYEFADYGADVDIAAPGVSIYGLMPDRTYTFASGPSMAAAYVTGIAALVKSCAPELSSSELSAILKKSVHKLNSLKGKVSAGGMIDACLCIKNARS